MTLDPMTCVEQNRCDKKTACQLFSHDIENFRLNNRIFLKYWESAWKGNQTTDLKYFKSDCKKAGFIREKLLSTESKEEFQSNYSNCSNYIDF